MRIIKFGISLKSTIKHLLSIELKQTVENVEKVQINIKVQLRTHILINHNTTQIKEIIKSTIIIPTQPLFTIICVKTNLLRQNNSSPLTIFRFVVAPSKPG